MEKNTVRLYGGKAYGVKVSEYGLENGYLDYYTLSEIVGDCIQNDYIFHYAGAKNWELENGFEDDVDDEYLEICQYYIISCEGARILKHFTNEIVYYNEDINMYLWGITHFGTSWDYVLTDIKLV